LFDIPFTFRVNEQGVHGHSFLCEFRVDWADILYKNVLWTKEKCRLGVLGLKYHHG
jgi:hypothetical protein